MDASVPPRPRRYFENAGDPGLLYYVAYGPLPAPFEVSRSRYRYAGSVELQLMRYGPDAHPNVVDAFREGILWNELARDDPALARAIAAQDECLVVRAEVADRADLDTLRDAVGLLTCCIDHGSVAIHDPQALAWWSPADWRERIFLPAGPVPCHHVVIPRSREPDGEWLHTRGMRKFGRPDLSVHGVGAAHRDAVVELLNRLIELQAFGGLVPDGERIRMPGLPPGMRCRRRGAPGVPDFSNAHIETEWPATVGDAH